MTPLQGCAAGSRQKLGMALRLYIFVSLLTHTFYLGAVQDYIKSTHLFALLY